jgi:hypothetical protein
LRRWRLDGLPAADLALVSEVPSLGVPHQVRGQRLVDRLTLRGHLLDGTGFCRGALLRGRSLLHLTLAGRTLRRPLLHPFSTSAVGDVSADLSVAGGQSLAKSGTRRSGCTRSCKCSKPLTSPMLPQPLTSFRR